MTKVLLRIREFGINTRLSTALKSSILLGVVLLFCSTIVFSAYSEDLNRGLADNLIRLHVIANSDSPEDQALKRNVRDSVISYMKTQLKESKDIEQTKNIINLNMDKITELANEEIYKYGRNYEVKTMLGSYPFPTKQYGDIVLPAGNYQALRVVIGKGEGANWWCVLFPPLCFVDATHGTVPDSVKADLKKVLTEEEYGIITTASSDEEIPIKIKFKVVEFFQDTKIKFSGTVNRIFNVQ